MGSTRSTRSKGTQDAKDGTELDGGSFLKAVSIGNAGEVAEDIITTALIWLEECESTVCKGE